MNATISPPQLFGCIAGAAFAKYGFDRFALTVHHFKKFCKITPTSNAPESNAELYTSVAHAISALGWAALSCATLCLVANDLQNPSSEPSNTQLALPFEEDPVKKEQFINVEDLIESERLDARFIHPRMYSDYTAFDYSIFNNDPENHQLIT